MFHVPEMETIFLFDAILELIGPITLSADSAFAFAFATAPLMRDDTRGTTTSMPTMTKRTQKMETSSVRTFYLLVDSFGRFVGCWRAFHF